MPYHKSRSIPARDWLGSSVTRPEYGKPRAVDASAHIGWCQERGVTDVIWMAIQRTVNPKSRAGIHILPKGNSIVTRPVATKIAQTDSRTDVTMLKGPHAQAVTEPKGSGDKTITASNTTKK